MSWGSYAHLSGAIELAQAATVKIGGGTAVMISDQFALTAAHVVIEDEANELTPNLTAINLWGETRAVINAYFDIAADLAVIELESPFQNSYSVKIASAAAQQDDEIFIVGHPWTTTSGRHRLGGSVWLVPTRSDLSEKILQNYQYLQCRLLPGGFSGSGLYNSSGDLVSIVSGQNNQLDPFRITLFCREQTCSQPNLGFGQ